MKYNENYPKYVQAMSMLDESKSVSYVCSVLHVGLHALKSVCHKYIMGGGQAFLRPGYELPPEPERKQWSRNGNNGTGIDIME